jgi:primosomal protein N' (replication factor Y)
MCSIGDVYRGAMPSALLLESETVISQKNTIADTSLFLMMNFSLRSSATAKCSKSSGYFYFEQEEYLPVKKKLIDKI